MEAIRGAADGCSNPSVDIPDNNEGGVGDQITLAAAGNVRDVDVEVNIAHPRVADIIIELRHTPSNKSVLLYKPDLLGDPCTGQDIEARLSDQAEGGFANDTCNPGTPAVDGVRIPADWLLQFQGATRAGPWVLQVYDAAGGNTGKLESWCVNAR
jgi:subtilisin-like proprotein convertase family protein